jgi:hypothetical protein
MTDWTGRTNPGSDAGKSRLVNGRAQAGRRTPSHQIDLDHLGFWYAAVVVVVASEVVRNAGGVANNELAVHDHDPETSGDDRSY